MLSSSHGLSSGVAALWASRWTMSPEVGQEDKQGSQSGEDGKAPRALRYLDEEDALKHFEISTVQVDVLDSFLEDFYDVQKQEGYTSYSRPEQKKSLLLMHILMVALAVEGYHMGARRCDQLRQGLKAHPQLFTSLYRCLLPPPPQGPSPPQERNNFVQHLRDDYIRVQSCLQQGDESAPPALHLSVQVPLYFFYPPLLPLSSR